MANKLMVQDIQAIKQLRTKGWSLRRIARELRISRNTVREHLRPKQPEVEVGGVGPESWVAGPADAQTDPLSTPGSGVQATGSQPASPTGRRSLCDDYRSSIGGKLEQGLTAQRIYQDLRLDGNFEGSYQSVKRFVAKLQQEQPERVWRIETGPAEEVQVDFGSGPVLELGEAKRAKTWIFRMVLSHSRKAYSEAVRNQTTENFIRCLENGFRHFGGVTMTINLDNLKAAVIKADWADPQLNPKLVDFARHYGTAIMPCLPRVPEHKGKVESGIKYIKSNALAGRKFKLLAALNEFLMHWERTVADVRIHGTAKRQVAAMFEKEKPHLLALPLELFPFFKEGERSVHRDGYVEVERSYYHVPAEYFHRQVWVRYDSREVRIFTRQEDSSLKQIQLHRRLEPGQFSQVLGIGGGQASLKANLKYWCERASHLGSGCALWAQGVAQNRGIEAIRTLMGLVSLSQKHGGSQINRACERAQARGAWRLRDVRALLHVKEIQTEIVFEQHHPLIRNLSEYGIFVQSKTQQS